MYGTHPTFRSPLGPLNARTTCRAAVGVLQRARAGRPPEADTACAAGRRTTGRSGWRRPPPPPPAAPAPRPWAPTCGVMRDGAAPSSAYAEDEGRAHATGFEWASRGGKALWILGGDWNLEPHQAGDRWYRSRSGLGRSGDCHANGSGGTSMGSFAAPRFRWKGSAPWWFRELTMSASA